MTNKTDQELLAEAMTNFGRIVAAASKISKVIDDAKKIVDSGTTNEPPQEDTSTVQAVKVEDIKNIQYHVQCIQGRHEEMNDLLAKLETHRNVQEIYITALTQMLDELIGEVD